MRKFADLSRGWGIGEETFEFWSWLARQYVKHFSAAFASKILFRHRIFAELLEQGTRSTLTIPTHLPNVKSLSDIQSPVDVQRNALEQDSMRVLGLNPTQALQHPGFYYYMAAQCTENRRMRFLQALENKVKACITSISGFDAYGSCSPAPVRHHQASQTRAKSII